MPHGVELVDNTLKIVT